MIKKIRISSPNYQCSHFRLGRQLASSNPTESPKVYFMTVESNQIQTGFYTYAPWNPPRETDLPISSWG